MTRSTPMSPDDRRHLLLGSARHVFAARGYHAANVSHIIEEAGVARGTFYNYFESKRAVFQEVLQELMFEVASAARPIDLHQPIAPQVHDNVANVVRAACAPDVARILLAEAVGIDPEGDAVLAHFYAQGLARIEAALALGQQFGVVRPLDPALLAACVLGMVKEPVFQAALAQRPIDVETLVDVIAAVLTGGALRLTPDA
jgi:AcrR family transcriptional regulator